MLPELPAAVFTWRGVGVTIAAPAHPALSDEISRFLAIPWAPASSTVSSADIVVSPDRTIEWRGGAEACACDTDADVVMVAVALVSVHLLERTTSVVLHAGAFVVDGHALLFSGPPRVGKSTVAWTAWRAGYQLVSDDWTVLEPDAGFVAAFPKPIKTRGAAVETAAAADTAVPDACALQGRLMSGELRRMYSRRLERTLDYDVAVPVGALFLLERHAGQPTRISPASRDRALQTVLEQTIRTRGPGLGAVKALSRLLTSRAVFHCQIGDDDARGAVEAMASAFRQKGATR
jgi:hypothetical protein